MGRQSTVYIQMLMIQKIWLLQEHILHIIIILHVRTNHHEGHRTRWTTQVLSTRTTHSSPRQRRSTHQGHGRPHQPLWPHLPPLGRLRTQKGTLYPRLRRQRSSFGQRRRSHGLGPRQQTGGFHPDSQLRHLLPIRDRQIERMHAYRVVSEFLACLDEFRKPSDCDGSAVAGQIKESQDCDRKRCRFITRAYAEPIASTGRRRHNQYREEVRTSIDSEKRGSQLHLELILGRLWWKTEGDGGEDGSHSLFRCDRRLDDWSDAKVHA